jgi:hypothetical protein
MLSDYAELLSILNAHRVKYLVIGAYALAIHAQPRATKDLDILMKADPENAKAVFAALVEFGAPLQGLTLPTSRSPARFSVWAASRSALTSSQQFRALSLTPHGRVELRTFSMRKPIYGRTSFPVKTCLQQNAPPADRRTSPT